MKTVFALVFLTAVSKSVQRVREFRRSPEHDNLLLFNGRPLSVEEFNKFSPKLLSDLGKQTYGVMPSVKLVEVEVAEILESSTPPLKPSAPQANSHQKAPVPSVNTSLAAIAAISLDLPTDVDVEPVEGGFVIGDYREGDVQFLGAGSSGWQSDISLTEPFLSADAAKAFFLGVTIPAPADATQPAAGGDAPVGDTAGAASESAPESNSPESPDSSAAPATPARRASRPATKQAKKQAKPASDAT